MTVQREQQGHRGAFFIDQDGVRAAELTFSAGPDGKLVMLDHTEVGDLIAFLDAGAYGFSMASHYNARLLPPEVMLDGSSARLIRERQTLEDLMRGQR